MFKDYIKPATQAMRPYIDGEDMKDISVSASDKKLKTLIGGMIAVNSDDPKDMWYVGKEFFDANYVIAKSSELPKEAEIFGAPDTWQLICKASGPDWMESTKAMELTNLGCLVQVTTQIGNNIAESVTFAPQVRIDIAKGHPILKY